MPPSSVEIKRQKVDHHGNYIPNPHNNQGSQNQSGQGHHFQQGHNNNQRPNPGGRPYQQVKIFRSKQKTNKQKENHQTK